MDSQGVQVPQMDNEAGSWRWVVLTAAFFNLLLNASTSYHVGVLNIALLEEYHSDVFMTSWLVALYASLFALAAPLGSIIINISYCRTCVFLSGILSLVGFVSSSFVTRPEWLFFTITLAGIGQSICFMGGTVVLAFYFPTLTSIANGICLCGGGLGSFIHPVLLQTLVDQYSLKGAFLILGGVSFHSCIAALIFRPTKIEIQRHKKNKRESVKSKVPCSCFRHLRVLRYPAFICLTLSVFCHSIGVMTTPVYLPAYWVNVKGLSFQEASLMASLVGIGCIFSRLFVGFAAADLRIGEELMFIGMNIVSFFFCVIATSLMSFRAGIYIFSLAFGIYASGAQPLFSPLTFKVLGFDKAPSGYGIIVFAFGCAALMGPPFCAILIEKIGFEAFFQFNEKKLHSSFCSIEFTIHATNADSIKDNLNLLDEKEKVISNHEKTYHNIHADNDQCEEADASIPLCQNTLD